MMRRRFAFLLMLTAIAAAQPAAAQLTITFDDLPGAENAVPNGYKGLNWSNFNFLRATTFTPSPSGYLAGLTSGSKVAYSGFTSVQPQSISAATPFQLFSFQMTAAWYDGISVEVSGLLGGSEVFRQTLNPSSTSPTLYSFGGASIDTLTFVHDENSGTPNLAYGNNCCQQFALDDLIVDGVVFGVPEPASWVLLMAGFGAVGSQMRRRRQITTLI